MRERLGEQRAAVFVVRDEREREREREREEERGRNDGTREQP